VRLMPTGTPPHRGRPQASAAHRLAMVRLAAAGNPRFRVDEHEIHRQDPCYMVDTLARLRAELGNEQPLILFIGADALAGLTTWHAWRRLFDLAHLAVATRAGFPSDDWNATLPAELAEQWRQRLAGTPEALRTEPAGRVYRLAFTQMEISASRLRQAIAGARSVRYLLPDPVYDYLTQHQLYR
jgi:nicotinate-nucleotide adenylyltransferase